MARLMQYPKHTTHPLWANHLIGIPEHSLRDGDHGGGGRNGFYRNQGEEEEREEDRRGLQETGDIEEEEEEEEEKGWATERKYAGDEYIEMDDGDGDGDGEEVEEDGEDGEGEDVEEVEEREEGEDEEAQGRKARGSMDDPVQIKHRLRILKARVDVVCHAHHLFQLETKLKRYKLKKRLKKLSSKRVH